MPPFDKRNSSCFLTVVLKKVDSIPQISRLSPSENAHIWHTKSNKALPVSSIFSKGVKSEALFTWWDFFLYLTKVINRADKNWAHF